MSTVKAYYDGLAFLPIEPVQLLKGSVVNLSILFDDSTNKNTAERLSAFRKLTNEFRELNKTEPLSPEFDELLNKRVNFVRELDL